MAEQITSVAVEAIEISDLKASDLRREAESSTERVVAYRVIPISADGFRQSVAADMLWAPDAGRAGIAWGADAAWTDANGPQDAAERFFGIADKEMSA